MSSLSTNEIDINKFKKVKRINRGGFGVVYEVKEIKTGKLYAAKVIDCGDDEVQCNKMIDREIGIMICAKHPTIVNFIGYSKQDFQSENNITIIMELAENGSLADVLKQIQRSDGPKDYTNTTRQIIITGIARGMKYLHDHNIIHRDLKTANILLDSKFEPHITDFGMSKKFDTGHSYSQSQFGGTLTYEAPEIFQNKPYNRKVDVYSFAIIMFEVLTDSVPYPELAQGKLPDHEFKMKVINECYRPKFNVPVKKSLRELIEKCWSKDPNNRPSFREIFRKLSNINKDDDDDDYLIEDVDIDDFKGYVDDITDESDQIEKLLDKIDTLEKDSEQFKNKIKKLEYENKQKSETISKIEKENQQLKEEINKLKSFQKIEPHNPKHFTNIKTYYPLNTISASALPNKKKRTKFIDICFVIDATSSMHDSFNAMIDFVNDFSFDFSFNFRNAYIRYGCVVLRDSKSCPIGERQRKSIENSLAKKKQRRKEKMIAHNDWDDEIEELNEKKKLNFDRNKYPINKTVPIDFCDDFESNNEELIKVECSIGKDDDQKDWAGALECALEKLEWIDESIKVIIFISNSNAYGKRFCGINNNSDMQEQKLINIIQSIAKQNIRFIGLNAPFNNDKGCTRTLEQIKEIYQSNGGRSIIIDDLKIKLKYEYLGDDSTVFDKEIEFDTNYVINIYVSDLYDRKPKGVISDLFNDDAIYN